MVPIIDRNFGTNFRNCFIVAPVFVVSCITDVEVHNFQYERCYRVLQNFERSSQGHVVFLWHGWNGRGRDAVFLERAVAVTYWHCAELCCVHIFIVHQIDGNVCKYIIFIRLNVLYLKTRLYSRMLESQILLPTILNPEPKSTELKLNCQS